MYAPRLILKMFFFPFVFVIVLLWSAAPTIACEKSGPLFSVPLLESQSEGGNSLGSLQPQQEENRFKFKSEKIAFRWSLLSTLVPITVGTAYWVLDNPKEEYHTYGSCTSIEDRTPSRAIPIALISYGIIIGPSTGYFYTGEGWRGIKGVAIRLVLGGGTGLCFLVAVGIGEENYANSTSPYGEIAFVGGAALLADVIYDLAKVKSTVRKHNTSLQETGLILAPKYFADSKACGIGLQIRF